MEKLKSVVLLLRMMWNWNGLKIKITLGLELKNVEIMSRIKNNIIYWVVFVYIYLDAKNILLIMRLHSDVVNVILDFI